MTNIKQHLQTDFANLNETSRAAIEEDMQSLQNSIEQAERMIQSTFSQINQGGGEHE